jgi:hypothetical protein
MLIKPITFIPIVTDHLPRSLRMQILGGKSALFMPYLVHKRSFALHTVQSRRFGGGGLFMFLFVAILNKALSKNIAGSKRDFTELPRSSQNSESDGEPSEFAPTWVKLVRTPGDGSCLFHALSCSLSGKLGSASDLRIRVVQAIPALASSREFNGATLEQWIEWETGLKPAQYVSIMARNSAWGGQVHVFIYTSILGLTQIKFRWSSH